MLSIARGLMAKPSIILLDEPSLGLAPAIINELFEVLAELRDDGVTILLVDQMATLALALADRGYVLDQAAWCAWVRLPFWLKIRSWRRPISVAPKQRSNTVRSLVTTGIALRLLAARRILPIVTAGLP